MSQSIQLRLGLLLLSLKCTDHRIVTENQAIVYRVCDNAGRFAMAYLEGS